MPERETHGVMKGRTADYRQAVGRGRPVAHPGQRSFARKARQNPPGQRHKPVGPLETWRGADGREFGRAGQPDALRHWRKGELVIARDNQRRSVFEAKFRGWAASGCNPAPNPGARNSRAAQQHAVVAQTYGPNSQVFYAACDSAKPVGAEAAMATSNADLASRNELPRQATA